MGPVAGGILGSMLLGNRHLHTLILCDTELGDDGLRALVPSLKVRLCALLFSNSYPSF